MLMSFLAQGRMRRSGRPSLTAADVAIDTYEMANLFPRSTGLPLVVWVGPRNTVMAALTMDQMLGEDCTG